MTPEQERYWHDWFDHVSIHLVALKTMCAMQFATERASRRLIRELVGTPQNLTTERREERYREILVEEEAAIEIELASAIECAKAEARKWNPPRHQGGQNQ